MKNNLKTEKEYDIRIVASIMENGLLCNNIEEIFDLSQDLINKEVDVLNYQSLEKEIIFELKKQYPSIKRLSHYPTTEYTEGYSDYLVQHYKKCYGDTLKLEVYKRKVKALKPFNFSTR